MTAPPDTAAFDAWLKLWPDARQYLVFAAVGEHLNSLMAGTPEFDKAVAAWSGFWAGHVGSKGLKPEQFGFLLIDEPSDPEPQATILSWAKALRAAGTGFRVWEDPVFKEPAQADRAMLEACHALCPNRPLFLDASQEYRDLFLELRDKGIQLEFYSCSGPVRTLDPYSYHRLQAWDCWRYGAKASYFWAFGDSGEGSSWNEYASARSSYTPLFLDATSVTTGKHLEACREGIEDCEYLVMLDAAVRKAAAIEGESDRVKHARALLDKLPERVCEAGRLPSFQWSAPLDRAQADAARLALLDALLKLSGS
jgi:hypothetical protein